MEKVMQVIEVNSNFREKELFSRYCKLHHYLQVPQYNAANSDISVVVFQFQFQFQFHF